VSNYQGSAPVADERIGRALRRGHLIDITTTGRRTGLARRIEIVFHVIDGRIYITGMASPRRRSWLANLEAEPRFTFHLKGPVQADLPAKARIIDDELERRTIFREVVKTWTNQDVERMTAYSPLIEVTFEPLAA
jgi:deazaflavin-dependent oxidoreductase (nitroreductase family)